VKVPALLIDTSTRHLIFARIEEGKAGLLLAKVSAMESEDTIDDVVAELFPRSEDIAELWLGQGPGSFVGLRSSFAYARMLSMLGKIPCRTFLSSRLWRAFFGVAPEAWFLTRTNARLYYAERYTTAREAEAVDVAGATALVGEKFCFIDSWIPSSQKDSLAEINLPWKERRFVDARLGTEFITPEILQLSGETPHLELQPLYGHELNFVLAAEPRPLQKNT
jgi:tRNA A37 threonylcarbamoyladenosine modification protein TsaB